MGINKWWEKYGSSNITTRYKSSLGWKDNLSKTTSYYGYGYSTRGGYFYESKTKNLDEVARIILKAIKATRDMIVILDFPFKIRICLNDEDLNNRTFKNNKERNIFISTEPIDDNSIDEVEKINIICGSGIHEATHLMYTEIFVLELFSKKISEYSTSIKKLAFLIANILEDERIEDILLNNRPGFSGFIDNYKKYNLKVLKKVEESITGVNKKISEILLNVLKLIRFPEDLNEKVIEDNNEFFKEISDVIKTPTINTKDCCEKSKSIINTLLNYFISKLGYSKDTVDSCISLCLNKGLYDNYFINVFSGKDGESKFVDVQNKFMSSYVKDKSSGKILSNLVNGKSELGDSKNVYFTKIEKNNSVKYNEYKKEISPLIPSIKKIIQQTDKNYKFNIYGCRSGILDTNKLAEAYQNIPQVYLRQGEVRTNKTTICVLLDESGSMESDHRYYRARLSAILLNEALGSLPGVDLYIYGHSADISCEYSVDINIYREGKTFNPKYSLSEVKPRNENRDGKAILETAKRVRKFTSDPCLMFVISDGAPCAYDYWGAEAIKDVRDSVSKVEKMNFSVFQISIAKVCNVDQMFNKYTEIFDLSNLPKKMGNLIKKSVIDNKKTIIV